MEDLPIKPHAVVVDTNIWNYLDLAALRRLADRLSLENIETWVPELVILEWASHASGSISTAAKEMSRLAAAELAEPVTVEKRSAEEIAVLFRTAMEAVPNLRVIPTSGAAAVAGLRDQVLGTGPGSTAKGTKTGAVDSAWIRDAVSIVAHHGTLVFLTNNTKDVLSTFRSLGLGGPIVRNLSTLWKTIRDPDVPNNEQLLKLAAYVESQISVGSYGPAWTGGTVVDEVLLWDSPTDFQPTGIEFVDYPILAGISDVALYLRHDTELGRPNRESGTAEFTVVLLGDVDIQGYVLDNNGQVETISMGPSEALITIQCTATLKDGTFGAIQWGDANFDSRQVAFATHQDALMWLATTLSGLAGIEFGSDVGFPPNESSIVRGPHLRSAKIAGDDGGRNRRAGSSEMVYTWARIFGLPSGPSYGIYCFDFGSQSEAAYGTSRDLPKLPYVLTTESDNSPWPAIAAIWDDLVLYTARGQLQ